MTNDEWGGSTQDFSEILDLDFIYVALPQVLKAMRPIRHSSFEKLVIHKNRFSPFTSRSGNSPCEANL
jgi:hypothetical protein